MSTVWFFFQILLLCLLSCINGQRDRIKIDPKLTMDQIILRAMGGTNSK